MPNTFDPYYRFPNFSTSLGTARCGGTHAVIVKPYSSFGNICYLNRDKNHGHHICKLFLSFTVTWLVHKGEMRTLSL